MWRNQANRLNQKEGEMADYALFNSCECGSVFCSKTTVPSLFFYVNNVS